MPPMLSSVVSGAPRQTRVRDWPGTSTVSSSRHGVTSRVHFAGPRAHDRIPSLLPAFDAGFAALLDRLAERNLLSDTAIFCAGEFGRTPKINPQGGRDHWARAMCAVIAGGDIKGGRAVGKSDATASQPAGDGYSPDDLAATFFQNIGIDPHTEFQSNVGRPITLVRDGTPIKNLF